MTFGTRKKVLPAVRVRASYKFGVQWIAGNDEPSCLDSEEISGFISTLLLADLFHVSPEKVAQDVRKIRRRFALEQSRRKR